MLLLEDRQSSAPLLASTGVGACPKGTWGMEVINGRRGYLAERKWKKDFSNLKIFLVEEMFYVTCIGFITQMMLYYSPGR